MWLPSDAQAGDKDVIPDTWVSVGRGVRPEPSAFITQTFVKRFEALLPSKAPLESNAILLPSGDQDGPMLSDETAVNWVSGVAPEPSGFITHMFEVRPVLKASLPSRARSDSYAIVSTATVKVAVLELPPPGAGLTTLTDTIPGAA